VNILAKDEKLRKTFGKNGRQKVEKVFTLSKSIKQVEELLDELSH
jgi:glycosyltransferase involved in cell wall biosynthesis